MEVYSNGFGRYIITYVLCIHLFKIQRNNEKTHSIILIANHG